MRGGERVRKRGESETERARVSGRDGERQTRGREK